MCARWSTNKSRLGSLIIIAYYHTAYDIMYIIYVVFEELMLNIWN